MTSPTAERVAAIRADLAEAEAAGTITLNELDLIGALDHVAAFLRTRLERVPLDVYVAGQPSCNCEDCTEIRDMLAYIEGRPDADGDAS